MFLSIGKTLKKMGGFRIGAHFKLKGVGLLVGGMFIFMFYLVYWSFLLMAWTVYGVCYLYYLMFKGIAYLFGYRKKKPDSAITVYYVPGGKSYHLSYDCVGSANVHSTTLDKVQHKNLSPCGRCCRK